MKIRIYIHEKGSAQWRLPDAETTDSRAYWAPLSKPFQSNELGTITFEQPAKDIVEVYQQLSNNTPKLIATVVRPKDSKMHTQNIEVGT